MKTLKFSAWAFSTLLLLLLSFAVSAQHEASYKHPYLNEKGEVLDSDGTKLGWLVSDGTVKNSNGETVGYIKGTEVQDGSGKKIGWVGKNSVVYDNTGAVVLTVDPKSKGERCKLLDPDGKIVAEVHESYKNQACALHCLGLTKKKNP